MAQSQIRTSLCYSHRYYFDPHECAAVPLPSMMPQMVAETPRDRITVLFVDDNPDVTAMFSLAASREKDLHCVGTLCEADGLVDAVRRLQPQVVILDLTMPGHDPYEALRDLHQEVPDARVIVFSGYDDDQTVDRAIEAGAWGFVSKHHDPKSVFNAIRQVAAGETILGK